MGLTLFPFQEFAINYLVDKRAVLIGDEMGLGKSIQAVTLDRMRRDKHPNLVKKPKTLVVTYMGIFSSWQRHFLENTNLRVCTINPKNRQPFVNEIYADSADVYLCHWQSLRLMEELQDVHWFHIIGDECHALQNRKSQQTKALKKLKSEYKTGLSGTPAFDKPDDLWSILNWLYPKYWTSYWRYYDEHVVWLDSGGYKVVVGVKNEKKLQEEMRGFYLRRKKQEVISDLPDKYYSTIEVELTPKQRRAYEQMRKDMLTWVGEHENEPVAAPVVIAQLTRLQQFSDAYGEIEKVLKKDRDTGEEYYLEVMKLAEPSSKLDALMDLLENTNEPIVVFSQFSMVIELLRPRLEKAGIPHGIFVGSTPADVRAQIINNFQSGKIRVFAGTIAAGGVGITLTAASTVVFIDRSWSASNNIQAEDRLHRIGQKNAVQVIDIISTGTIDAKRIQQINLHWTWIKRLLGDDNNGEEEEEYDW